MENRPGGRDPPSRFVAWRYHGAMYGDINRASRRQFLQASLAVAGLGLLSGCGLLLPHAQQAARPLIGWVSGASAAASASITDAFR